jgi:lipoprotein NlpI
MIANLGYREAGMNEQAEAVISEAAKKCDPDKWTYSIIRYLKGDLSGDELLQLATNNDKKTEAYAYIGMDLLLKGKRDEARTHFNWVKEYGNRRFLEYPLALEELKRIAP